MTEDKNEERYNEEQDIRRIAPQTVEFRNVEIALVANDVRHLIDEVKELKRDLSLHYVLQIEFMPVKRLVYGCVGLICTGVIGAIIMLLLRSGGK